MITGMVILTALMEYVLLHSFEPSAVVYITRVLVCSFALQFVFHSAITFCIDTPSFSYVTCLDSLGTQKWHVELYTCYNLVSCSLRLGYKLCMFLAVV